MVDAFANEMTDVATHVLQACSHLERHDLLFFGRQMYCPPVLPPAEERKPKRWMFGQLAKRLGLDLSRELSTSTHAPTKAPFGTPSPAAGTSTP